MTITLKEIKEKKKVQMSFLDDSIKELIKDCKFNEPVEIKCTFILKPDKVTLNIEISGLLSANCDRCLENFTRTIKITEKRDIKFDEFGEEFNISEEAFQDILLSLPMKFLCSEDCKGLCPICGQNLNFGKCNCEIKNSQEKEI